MNGTIPASSTTYQAPNWDVHENERGQDWWLGAARYFAQFYNNPQYGFRNTSYLPDGPGGIEQSAGLYFSPIDEIIDNWSFFLGRQSQGHYAAFYSDFFGGIGYRPGNEIYEVIINKVGRLSEFFSQSSITAELLSPEARSRKQLMIDLALFQVNASAVMQDLEIAGATFSIIPPQMEVKSKEQLLRIGETTFKEYGCEIAEEIALNHFTRLNLENLYKNAGLQLEVAGIAGIENQIVNGKLIKKLIAGHQIVWDNSIDDEHNKYGRFRGYFEYWVSPDEIIARYGADLNDIDPDAIDYLKNLKNNVNVPSWVAPINTLAVNGQNVWWGGLGVGENAGTVSLLHLYFKGPKDSRWKKIKGRWQRLYDDNDKFRKKYGYRIPEIWWHCIVIGNKWVVECGPAYNQTYDVYDSDVPVCPMTICIPNMAMNQYISDVGRIKAIQRQIDLCQSKINELFAKDYGKNYFLNFSALGLSKDEAQEVFQDFRSQRISFVSSLGEIESNETQQRTSELIDLSLDPNVKVYADYMIMYKQILRENIGVPDVALGTQPSYIGKGVQDGTLASVAISMNSFFRCLLQFCQQDLQVGVNMQKISFYSGDNDEAVMEMIGQKGLNFIKSSAEYSMERLGVYLKFEDIISATQKNELKQVLLAEVQNKNITTLEYVTAISMRSYTSIRNYFEGLMREKEIKAQLTAEEAATRQMEVDVIAANTDKEKAKIAAQATIMAAERRSQAQENAAKENADAKRDTADTAGIVQLAKNQNKK